jgi:hypothetical protein
MRRLLLLIFLVALGAAPAAHAQSLTIEARGNADGFGTVRNVGGFKPVRDPRLRAAIAAYGTPSRRVGAGSEVCRVSWADIGAKVLFANFGGVDACRPANGLIQGGRLSGPSWRTARGLRVGHDIRRLRALYPRAERHGRVLWLATGLSRIGTPQRYPVLAAWMRDGRVRSFTVQVFAAGD